MFNTFIKNNHISLIFKGNISPVEKKVIKTKVFFILRTSSLEDENSIVTTIESINGIPSGAVTVNKKRNKIVIRIKL